MLTGSLTFTLKTKCRGCLSITSQSNRFFVKDDKGHRGSTMAWTAWGVEGEAPLSLSIPAWSVWRPRVRRWQICCTQARRWSGRPRRSGGSPMERYHCSVPQAQCAHLSDTWWWHVCVCVIFKIITLKFFPLTHTCNGISNFYGRLIAYIHFTLHNPLAIVVESYVLL